jgi:gamma-glutamyltranspeptidase/glutathione hydrolase
MTMSIPAIAERPRSRVLLAVLFALGAAACAHADDGRGTLGVSSSVSLPATAQGKAPSWTGRAFRQGVVSVANPHGAEAGAAILEQGGNAIDAAVAIAYALNVVEPQSAGIGGGGFMMIHIAKTGETITIDSREKAPAGATRDMFVGVPTPSLQGVAVGVPGMVRGTALALERYGRLSLAQVLQPAIRFADEGFAATPRFVASPNCANPNSRALNSAESANYFCPGGAAIPVGATVRNEWLADTFRLLATHGPDCFYKSMPDKGCDIALGIVAGQKFQRALPGSKGGSMTLADLEAYQPAVRAPIAGTYRGYTLKAMGPPSSGAHTVLQILKMLEPFPLGNAGAGFGYGAINTLNVMADAMRIAFADRGTWMADADFVPVPTRGLINGSYLALRDDMITPGVRLTPNPLPGDPRPYEVAGIEPASALALALPPSTENGTTHFSVVDKHGNVVSYTNTIESGYGIGVFAGYTRPDGSFRNHGFLLNNELTDFNTTPTTNAVTGEVGYNDVQPGKRPRSSMTPTMLFTPQGKPFLAYGSPGGATIINSVVNVTINLIDHRMTLQQAIDAGRISVAGVTSSITLETNRLPFDPTAALVAMGYSVSAGDVGSVQAVLIDQQTGKQYGAADDRREGTVIGLPR